MQTETENTPLSSTLDSMGIVLKVGRQLDSREGWGRGFRHFIVYVCRDEKPVIQVTYSMGSAYTEDPIREDVLHSILLDAMYGRESFESFCVELGYDEDSRKAYAMWEECVRLDGYVSAMFTPTELETLSELFQDY